MFKVSTSKSIFFYCCPQSFDEYTGFDHQTIVLAEGLINIGVKIYSNRNYWKTDTNKTSFLICTDDKVKHYDCDVVIFNLKYYHSNTLEIPKELFSKKRKYTLVCIDEYDGLITPSYRIADKVDLVLKCHYNNKFKYPPNFIPWQFGLSQRIIESTRTEKSIKRKNTFLLNYRSFHAVRLRGNKEILPIVQKYYHVDKIINKHSSNPKNLNPKDQLNFVQTGRRHYPSYYTALKSALGCFCFGGFLTNKYLVNDFLMTKVIRKLNYKLEFIKNDRVFQWDSWRLWETMSAGSIALHLDFEKYGMKLPQNPINGQHYIGVDFDNLSKLEELMNDSERLELIGKNGQKWVQKHYSPKSIAIRFLKIIDSK